MMDESSHMPLSLWLRSVGLENPFDDQSASGNGSERSNGSRNPSTGSRNGGGGGNNSRRGELSRGESSRGNASVGIDHYLNDVLVPPEDAEERQMSIYTGSTVLAMTLAGTCAIDAPYAFQKCGIFWATILFLLLAVFTERALQMICICARKTGSNSYGTLSRSSCGGYRVHLQTSLLEIGVLMFLSVHVMSCLRRILALWLQSFDSLITISEPWALIILAIIFVAPLNIPKQLNSLGGAWTLGLLSIGLFTATVGVLAVLNFYKDDDQQHEEDQEDDGNNSNRRTVWDVVEGFQSLLIVFFASFNALPIQAALYDPTRERMATVVHQGVIWGASATYLIGLVGHLCVMGYSPQLDADFLESIQYNPPSNHNNDETKEGGTPPTHDFLLVYQICHTCCILSIILAFPLVITPCRHSILELIESVYTERKCFEASDCQEDCETCSTRASTATSGNQNDAFVLVNGGSTARTNNTETTNLLPSIEENPTYDLLSSPLALGLCTFGILLWAYIGVQVVPFMDAFYTWVGPFMVYIFAFVLPALYFLGIRRPRHGNPVEKTSFRCYARILIFLCVSGIVFATIDIVRNLPRVQYGLDAADLSKFLSSFFQ